MSRSRRKIPVFGYTTADTEKKDKRHAARAFRRHLKTLRPLADEVVPRHREMSNVWCFDKDGKRYVHPHKWSAELLRKAMRK